MQKARYFTTQAFVLRTWVTGEQDLRIDLLTPTVGVVQALAKNALKSQRRFQGCLDPPSRVEASLTRRGERLFFEEASLIDGCRDLPEVPARFVLMSYAVECLLSTAAYFEEGSPWFRFLEGSLRLVRSGPDEILMKKLLIDLKLLDLHGLRPRMDVCEHCEDEAPARNLVGLDVRAGSAVCAEHLEDHSKVIKPTRGVMKALSRLIPPRLHLPRAIVLGPRQLKEALEVAGRLIEEHLSLRPHSLRTLGQVLRLERRRARSSTRLTSS